MSIDLRSISPPRVASEIAGWREGALNTTGVAGAVGGAVLAALEIVAAVRAPSDWPLAVSATVLAAAAIVLAAHRGLSYTLRAWSLLVMGCLFAAVVLVYRGLTGSGRLFLAALPVLATILVGRRAGIVMICLGVLSKVTTAVSSRPMGETVPRGQPARRRRDHADDRSDGSCG